MDWQLFWTAFGAVGTTLGSLITAIAVVVAVIQYKQPLKKKVKLTVGTSIPVYGKELGEEMVSNAGEAAFAGRTKDDVYYASPEAYNWFLGKLHKIYH